MVYEGDDGQVLRMPRTAEARQAGLRQCQFLQDLGRHLPVAVPAPSACDDGALKYRKLPGAPLQIEMLETLDAVRLARDIAGFMSVLHSIPSENAMAWGVPAVNRTERLLAAADRVLPLLPVESQRAARRWREQFVEMAHPRVPIHGDLWFENILVDPEAGHVTGVIDWDEASIGDPAWDLATQLHCGRRFAEMVFDAYPLRDPEMWARAERLFPLRAFEGLDLAARVNDRVEFEEGLVKLREVGVIS